MKYTNQPLLPGRKDGVSSTVLAGFNIGINGYIKEENKEEAVEAIKYITSKEIQRKIMIEHKSFSGITSLYDEKEICDNKDFCEIFKNAQPVARPSSLTNDYNKYSEKFRYYAYKYIYGNDDVDPKAILKKIDDITRIYYISINSKDSNIGKVIATIYALLSIIILFSAIFLFNKRMHQYFDFLPNDFWILSLIGYVLIIFISYLDLEKATVFKCHLKLFLQFTTFTIIFIPILYKLISNYPEINKVSDLISNHRHLFLFTFIFFDILINGLVLIQPYTINDIIVNDDKNYQRCKVGGLLSRAFIILAVALKFTLILISFILLFVEWNLKITYYDIRLCTATYCINTLLTIILTAFDYINIRNYNTYFSVRESLIMLHVISDYSLLYAIRIIWFKMCENKERDYYIERIPQSSIDSTPSYLRKFSNNYDQMASSYNVNNINNSYINDDNRNINNNKDDKNINYNNVNDSSK
eukprot:jgi/Orpsp1_1/1176318/evm.model.c7180000057168.1